MKLDIVLTQCCNLCYIKLAPTGVMFANKKVLLLQTTQSYVVATNLDNRKMERKLQDAWSTTEDSLERCQTKTQYEILSTEQETRKPCSIHTKA